MRSSDLSLPATSLARRTLRTIDNASAVEEAKAEAEVSVVPMSQPVFAASRCNAKCGEHMFQSMLAIPQGPTPGTAPSCDVQALLTKAGMDVILSDALAEAKLFSDLERASKKTADGGKQAYTYVDLAAKEMLPFWLTPENVCGSTTLQGEEEMLDSPASTATIAQAHTA